MNNPGHTLIFPYGDRLIDLMVDEEARGELVSARTAYRRSNSRSGPSAILNYWPSALFLRSIDLSAGRITIGSSLRRSGFVTFHEAGEGRDDLLSTSAAIS